MAKKKTSVLPIIALGGIGLVAIYALSQYGGDGDTTGTGGWTGGTGTRSLTPIVTETTETTIPIGGGEYPQIVLPSIPPYEQPALPEWLFAPPAPTVTTAPPPTAPAPIPAKKDEPVKLSESWAGPLTGITVYGETGSITYPVSLSTDGAPTSKKAVDSGGGGGIPAKQIQDFFSAGKDYSTPTYTKPAPSGGTTYHYESGAFQTVQQGQITVSGSAGSVQGLRELASQGNKTAQMLARKAGLI